MNMTRTFRPGAEGRLAVIVVAGVSALLAIGGCVSGDAASVSGGAILTLDDGNTSPLRFAGLDAPGEFISGPDTLTALSLPLPSRTDRQIAFAQAEVENHSIDASPGLAVSHDGDWALVATPSDSSSGGAQVAAVALSDPSEPVVVESMGLEGGGRVSVAFHPFEPRAAALTATPPTLTFIELGDAGAWGMHTLPLTGMLDEASSPASIAWHPSGRFMAIVLGASDRVCFVQVRRSEEGAPMIRKWGNEIATDPAPRTGVFSPDGRFFITANVALRDEPDVQVIAASGTLSVIRMSDSMEDGASHRRVGTARLPHRPHAMAMAPGGDRIVTVSRRAVDLEAEDRSKRLRGTIALTGFDPVTGAATPGRAQETSSLPSAVCFDSDGSHALVADFETSEIQVWRAGGEGLEYTGLNIGTGYGPHAIAVLP